MITVSVVIPCYNRAETIAEAVASALSQTRAALEVIVVDDASTDDSAAVAERAGARVIRMPLNRGNAAARNVGAAAATGDAIAWLDSDDYWDTNHLEIAAGLLDLHPTAAAGCTAVRFIGSRSGLWYGQVPATGPTEVVREAFSDWLMPLITAIMRRDAVNAVGGCDERERYSVDFDLWLRLSLKWPFVASREVTGNWRWHSKQLSSSPERQWEALYRSRRRALDSLTAEGRDGLVAELSEIFRVKWEGDLQRAWDEGRSAWLLKLVELSALVPNASPSVRRKWALRSRIPRRLVSAIRAARSVAGG